MRLKIWIKRGLCAAGLWFGLAAVCPFPDEKLAYRPVNTRYQDRERGLLRRELAENGEDRDWISLAESGRWAGQALIAVEDQRFYHHPGVDPIAVLRAAGQNIMHGGVLSGASTISTQVIRLIEPRPRNLLTKGIEAFRATQLELRYDKDFILEQYLNRAPYGGNRTSLATASRRYFGKEPMHLSAGEAALLMGLPQSPSRFRPDHHPEKAERRREMVLARMQAEGMLSALPLMETGERWVPPPLRAFHFTEWIRQRHGQKGGTLQTSLDAGMQASCEHILTRWRGDSRYGECDGVGVLLMDAKTGEVRVWVSGWDAGDPLHTQVDTVTRKRAPGSTLKPFAFAQAMQAGWLTPETRLEDLPQVYEDYQPDNMNERWSGDVSARSALVQSLNMPALKITGRVGVANLLGVLRSSGMELSGVMADEVGMGAVLGGGMEVSLLELVQSYAVFARGGKGIHARGLLGSEVVESVVFSEGVAYWISRMLSGAERDGALYGHGGDVVRPDLAFKTGTSHGLRDAWAVGWNDEWVLGVWVGRMDGGSVNGLSGSSHAAPLLGELAGELFGPGSEAWPEAPESVVQWKGREVIAGVTDPALSPKVIKVRNRILRPDPNFQIQLLDGERMMLPMQVSGEGEVDWFVNGAWVGKVDSQKTITREFEVGAYEIRAVFADGSADTRRVKILGPSG
ncbi:transglycosylase domain-containing protein [Kiritimatiellaeota bacterium B1221]|nr:transglycosylase domain-containing protein [Kiritimatiellaeota bacterium B1221]